MFHADSYRSILGAPIQSEFGADVSPVNIKRVRHVDQPLARRLGEKLIEEIPGLGSRVNLGTMNVQTVNGCFGIRDGNGSEKDVCFDKQLIWVGPLVHDNVFKYWGHGTTPGYVMVSAIDPTVLYMVMAVKPIDESAQSPAKDNGRMGAADLTQSAYKEMNLRYLMNGGYFGSYVKRLVRANGYMSSGLTDYSFEIDDSGRPHWVITRYDRTVGFNGEDTVGVVVVDLQTGDIKEYGIDDAPVWIDRIQPESVVTQQLNDWGNYIHGFWNSVFAQTDIIKTTPGMSLVHGANGQAYWYSGLQSAGSSQGTNSFVLVNTRTKKVRRYLIAGANEQAAQASAENAKGVKEAGFKATSPILYNVRGIPSYFMTLKGEDGLVKMYAFVSVKNYETVGVGGSAQEALRDYQNSLIQQGQGLNADDLVKRERIEAVVLGAVKDGKFFYLRLEGQDGKEFFGTSDVSPELKWTEPGHKVVIDAYVGEQNSIPIIQFDNTDLKISTLE